MELGTVLNLETLSKGAGCGPGCKRGLAEELEPGVGGAKCKKDATLGSTRQTSGPGSSGGWGGVGIRVLFCALAMPRGRDSVGPGSQPGRLDTGRRPVGRPRSLGAVWRARCALVVLRIGTAAQRAGQGSSRVTKGSCPALSPALPLPPGRS